jgi:tetratricopeptide (TPR) repeat protein
VFAREVNENADMIASLENTILFKVDCEKGEGIAIAEKYEIRGYPTYIALNGKGDVTDRWIGYDGAEKWAASVVAAKADRRTIVAKMAAYEAEPTLALAKALASNASTGSQYKAAVDYYSSAREMDPQNAKEYSDQILMAMIYGLEDDTFTMDEVIAKAEPAMASEDTPVADKLEMALMMKHFASQKGQAEKAVPFIEAAWAASEGTEDEEALKYRNYLAVDYALLVEKDKDKAYGLFTGRMPEGWDESTEQLNKVAWWCFENEYKLEEAQAMALKGVELAPDDVERANILDTAAEICNALGNCDQALEHIKLAIELNPENDYFKDQLVKFEKAAQEKNEG